MVDEMISIPLFFYPSLLFYSSPAYPLFRPVLSFFAGGGWDGVVDGEVNFELEVLESGLGGDCSVRSTEGAVVSVVDALALCEEFIADTHDGDAARSRGFL